jgi:ATP-dependent DNA ligase
MFYVEHVVGRGADLFRLACEGDLEGIVAKWAQGRYVEDSSTSWLKIKNPRYSQMHGRREMFERDGRPTRRGRRLARPRFQLA